MSYATWATGPTSSRCFRFTLTVVPLERPKNMLSEFTAMSRNNAASEGILGGVAKGARFMRTAADKLSDTADYLREHDINRMVTDLRRLVRNYPGPTLIAAAAVGFLLGRTVTRNE